MAVMEPIQHDNCIKNQVGEKCLVLLFVAQQPILQYSPVLVGHSPVPVLRGTLSSI